MKLIFLNTWNGTQEKQIKKFLSDETNRTDIFCFQEVGDKMKKICSEFLENYFEFSGEKKQSENENYQNKTYIKEPIEILEKKVILKECEEIGLALYTKIKVHNKVFNIINCHGQPYPGEKNDTEARILQSQKILEFVKNFKEPTIIGGDFNLDIKTKSVEMFEKNGFLNLIKKFKIETTRNQVSWSKYPDHKQLFADFVFTKGIKIKSFRVPDSDYSDHLAMFLEI